MKRWQRGYLICSRRWRSQTVLRVSMELACLLAFYLHALAGLWPVLATEFQWHFPDEVDYDDVPDPSQLLHEIHAPTTNVAYMHQLSRYFLAMTKDFLSTTTRSPGNASVEADIAKSLLALQRMNPSDVSLLLNDHGLVIPPSHGVVCDPPSQSYRMLDGSCNNMANPCWGKAEEPYQRWLPPDYANGIDEPRKGIDGFPLPSPRMITQLVSGGFEPNSQTEIPFLTNLLVTWGQLLSHDILFTPTATVKIWNGREIVEQRVKCCNTTTPHPDCLPLIVDHSDSFYSLGHCLEFVRSSAYAHRPSACRPPALGRRREQINQLTSFVDASVVYGSSDDEMRRLREHGGRGARLMMSSVFGRQYLPRRNGTCKASRNFCDKRCFLVGEKRANENPALAALHTLLARQHNQLVERLRSRGWDEETLFHVVRKIVGAQMQHITYNEYLHLVLGDTLTNLLNLSVPTKGYVYEPNVNPSIYNSFVAAAYRFGHSMVSGRQKRKGKRLVGSPVLSQDFFSMDDFCDVSGDSVTKLLGGQAEQRAQKVDCIFTKEVTDHLFSKKPDGPGLDLVALNIQRGRDHGIPSYNRWREACGLRKARDYVDLRIDIPDEIVDRLEIAYGPGRVDDIDLYIGGIAELSVNNGILGPTFTCIVANQFRNLKFGDRFWYENLDHPGAFTQEQLNEIRKTTLASLICANSEVGRLQSHVFVIEGPHNPKLSCDVILNRHGLNLAAWP